MTRNRTPVASSNDLTGTTMTDATDIDLGGLDKSIGLESSMSLEELRDSLNATVSHDVNDPAFQRFTADANFMEEKVLVRVMPSADKNDSAIVEVWNGGTPQRFIRGEWIIVKRKYVEVLARAKPFSVATPEITDANGDRTTRIDTKNGLMYPFEMRDTNPVGAVWLQRVMQES